MQTVDLNMIPGKVMPVINVTQYDEGREFGLAIMDGNSSASLSGATLKINGRKQDDKGFSYDQTETVKGQPVISVSSGIVTIRTTKQMTAVKGDTLATLEIAFSTRDICTLNFILRCQENPLADVDISETELPDIIDAGRRSAEEAAQSATDAANSASDAATSAGNAATSASNAETSATNSAASALDSASSATQSANSATAAAGSATTAETNALKSEGYAVGKQNGTDVPSTSPYYHNNSAYWAEKAAQSAAEAEQYAQGGVIYQGSISFAQIPTSGMKAGHMYNMDEDFTTDSRFQEGAGIEVKAGTNIAWNGLKWDLLAVGGVGSFSGLADVNISNVSNGQVPKWSSTSQKWENGSISAGDMYKSTYDPNNDGIIAIAQGGTGASTVAGARNALGLGNTSGALPVANGGTGATSASSARSNLGLGSLATKSTASLTSDVSGILPIANGGTGNSAGYIRTGQKSGTSTGGYATAEGNDTTASGSRSHAEGHNTIASSYCSHAEGDSTTASKDYSHAEGHSTTASGEAAHAEGHSTTASGWGCHAEGVGTTASSYYTHAEGYYTTAIGDYSHAEGYYTTTSGGHHVQGHYNKAMTAGNYTGTVGDAMAIGNGSASTLSNAFRVTYAGAVYGLSAFNSSGADYAEFFEWEDGNKENEDRVGYFVTLFGDKIKKADAGDYILGIISGQPSVIGNGDEDWLGKWQRDDFGRFIWGEVEAEDPITKKKVKTRTILPNPEYDPEQKYIERKDRPEWDCVGMLGALAVRDDGTCEVNGFCGVKDGIATKAESGYRVIERVSDNVIRVIFR